MVEFYIRTFQGPQDFPAVEALWAAAGPGVQLGRSDTEEEIRKKLERDPDLFLVADLGGSVVGAVLGGFDGRRGLVYHLAVSENCRDQGVGSALMAELEGRLRQKGCLRCYLLVAPGNEALGAYYEARGWDRMPVAIYGKNLTD